MPTPNPPAAAPAAGAEAAPAAATPAQTPEAPAAAPATPAAAPLPAAVQELVDAARPTGGLTAALSRERPGEPAPETPQTPVSTDGAPDERRAPNQEDKAFSFAELAEQERTLRQRERALGVRQQEIQRAAQQIQEHQQTTLTKEQRLAAMRADPGKYIESEYGVTLQEVADYVAQGGGAPARTEAPEIRELREQLTQTQQRLAQFEQGQQQAVSQAQYGQAIAGLKQGLEQAKDSYPLLLNMLGADKAAEAIVQGVVSSYSGDSFKTADEVAQELEQNLRPIADRLIAGHPKLTAPQGHASPPQPPPRVTNRSVTSPAPAPARMTREERIERAAQELRFVDTR